MTALSSRQGALPKAAAAVLVAVSLGWVGWLLRDAWETVDVHRLYKNWPALAASFLVLMLSLLAALPSFRRIVEAVTARRVNQSEVARLYFVAQMMKHLPGRFFGIAYQATSAPHIATSIQWVGINIASMFLSLGAATAASVIILTGVGVIKQWGIPLIVAGGSGALLSFYLLNKLDCSSGSGWRRTLGAAANAVKALGDGRTAVWILGWYASSWIIYVGSWVFFGVALGEGAQVGMELCALYTLSWVLGFVTLVTPSGLGVRELAFVTLAVRHPPELVAYVAIVARLGMLAADLAIGMVCLLWKSPR